MPLVGLHDEDGAEHRPPYRPDLVLNPLPYDVDTRREDYRHYRLPISVVQGAIVDRPETRSILRSDPSVELLLFPHLYPYGHGQWIRSPDEIRVRRENTRGQDLKRKLNSIISRFRDDWYWPAYAYMEVEATRIFQHNCRIVSGRTRQALDGRMPNPELLQQSAYGPWSVINEKLTTTMPGFIRTGESYFLENERKIKAMLDTYNIPTLFVTITFNERWEPYTRLLGYPYNFNPGQVRGGFYRIQDHL
ncbi:hypothetical protein B0O99DRAFT_602268 [Bisporella sp. PMI_857]|nr:hypothetical protein B0O99DRAFT_602268 [Bisporella sp. PMI_857]